MNYYICFRYIFFEDIFFFGGGGDFYDEMLIDSNMLQLNLGPKFQSFG